MTNNAVKDRTAGSVRNSRKTGVAKQKAKALPLATPPVAGAQAPAVQSPASQSATRIFQIWYRQEHKPRLDPAFEPYDNSSARSALLEFRVLAELSQRSDLQQAPLWGALSWKFSEKTGMSGQEFKDAIAARPGYDAYFCNPHPETEAIYHNLWLQGETAHPNFLVLCREVFAVAGLPADMLTEIQPAEQFAACNYIVATPAFWKRYVGFVSRVLLAADRKLSATARAILYSPNADPGCMHANASYVPFLVERLLPVFLHTEGRDLRACKIAVRQPELNAHVKLLGEMKDLAVRSRSLWLATCWLNYRNLYLDKLHGVAWSRKYLSMLTPARIHFADAGALVPQKELAGVVA